MYKERKRGSIGQKKTQKKYGRQVVRREMDTEAEGKE
jgi:hypothetical protein